MSLEKRLDKIAATLAAKEPARQEIWKCIFGVEDKEAVLDRMVADGEITEDQRGDVRFIRRVFIEPVWDTDADGNTRLVGRRNVHTGEVEPVD